MGKKAPTQFVSKIDDTINLGKGLKSAILKGKDQFEIAFKHDDNASRVAKLINASYEHIGTYQYIFIGGSDRKNYKFIISDGQ